MAAGAWAGAAAGAAAGAGPAAIVPTAEQRVACERLLTRCQQAGVDMPAERNGIARVYAALVAVAWNEEEAFAALQGVDENGMINWETVKQVAQPDQYPLGDPEAWEENHTAASALLCDSLNALGFNLGNELTPSIVTACVGQPPPQPRAPMRVGGGPLGQRPKFTQRRRAAAPPGGANGGGAAGSESQHRNALAHFM